MKKIILFLIGFIITICSYGQNPITTKQLRLTNNTDSTGVGSTTGIIRYDPVTGKFRFYNALTSTWFSYSQAFWKLSGTSTLTGSATISTANNIVTFNGVPTSLGTGYFWNLQDPEGDGGTMSLSRGPGGSYVATQSVQQTGQGSTTLELRRTTSQGQFQLNTAWTSPSSFIDITATANSSGASLLITGLSTDNTETQLLSIDPTTGAVSKRDVSSIGSYTAGDGLTLSGSEFRIGGTLTANRSFTGDFKVTFGGGSTNASINLPGIAGNPSGVAVGDVWRNTTTDAIMGRWTTAGNAAFMYAVGNITNAIPYFSSSTLPGAVNASIAFQFDGTILRSPNIRITSLSNDNSNTTVLSVDGSGNIEGKTDLIDGSGSNTQIAFFSDANTLTTDSDLTFTGGGTLGVGVLSINSTGNIVSTGTLQLIAATASIDLQAADGNFYFTSGLIPTDNTNTMIMTRDAISGIMELRDVSTISGSVTLQATEIAYGSVGNNVTSEAAFNYSAALNLMTVGAISTTDIATTNALVSSLTTGRVVYVGASDALVDEAAFSYDASLNLLSVSSTSGNGLTSIFGGEIQLDNISGGDDVTINNSGIQITGVTNYSILNTSGNITMSNIVFYPVSTGNPTIQLGESSTGGTSRLITVDGSGSNIDLVFTRKGTGDYIFTTVRTSCAGAASGAIWNDGGTVKICP